MPLAYARPMLNVRYCQGETMSENDPHERDITLAKEKDEEDPPEEAEAEAEREEAAEEAREDEAEQAREEAEQREAAAREAENPDNHRDEPPHNS
jgi:hypothetical protein